MRPASPTHLLRLSHRHRQQSCLPQSSARHKIQDNINPVGGGLPAMTPASPTHLLRLSQSHRQQSCLPQSDARHGIQDNINPVGGGSAGDEASKPNTPAAPVPEPSPAERPPTVRCQAQDPEQHQSCGRRLAGDEASKADIPAASVTEPEQPSTDLSKVLALAGKQALPSRGNAIRSWSGRPPGSLSMEQGNSREPKPQTR